MIQIVLFHHVLGLTPGVIAFADRLRDAGYVVHTPDLFEGRRFDDIPSGLAYVREIGFGEVMNRGVLVAAGLPDDVVYGGFSLGVMPAQMLAQTMPNARGALFFYSSVSATEFGDGWPADLPVQIHAMDADPFFVDEGDIEAAHDLIAQANDGELFLYAGDGHLFADNSSPDFDAAATALLTERVLAFLAGVTKEA